MSEALLFENTFVIEAINNQKYDRVSRISAHSEDNATFLMLATPPACIGGLFYVLGI